MLHCISSIYSLHTTAIHFGNKMWQLCRCDDAYKCTNAFWNRPKPSLSLSLFSFPLQELNSETLSADSTAVPHGCYILQPGLHFSDDNLLVECWGCALLNFTGAHSVADLETPSPLHGLCYSLTRIHTLTHLARQWDLPVIHLMESVTHGSACLKGAQSKFTLWTSSGSGV